MKNKTRVFRGCLVFGLLTQIGHKKANETAQDEIKPVDVSFYFMRGFQQCYETKKQTKIATIFCFFF